MPTKIIKIDDDYGVYPIKNSICKSENGIEYELLQDQILGDGGQSMIYKCRSIHDNKEYALKFFVNEKINDLNTEENKRKYSLLKEISEKCNVVKVLDWGTISITYYSGEVKNEEFYFEIMDIYDGDINDKKMSYKEITGKLLPQILETINELHKHSYVHRDICPKNIFISEGNYYLGDAGTMQRIEEGSGGYGMADNHVANDGFTPLEEMPDSGGRFSIKSDYFRLGCTLAHTYIGDNEYKELTKESLTSLILRKSGIPINAKNGENKLQELINRLCSVLEEDRPGYKEVKLWMNNYEKFKDLYKRSDLKFSYIFNGQEYNDPEELAIAMSDNWDESLRHFLGGTSAPLFDALKYNSDLRAKAYEIYLNEINSHSNEEERGVVLSKILFLMNNKKTFIFKTLRFKKISELQKESFEGLKRILKRKYLSWAINELGELANKDYSFIPAIEEICKSNEQLAFEIFKRIPFEKTSTNRRYDFSSICLGIVTGYFNNKSMVSQIDNNTNFWSQIFLHGGIELINEYQKNRYKYNNEEKVIHIFLIIEKIDDKRKEKYREMFFEKGPLSYIGWFKNNLSYYRFNSSEMKNLEQQMKNISVKKTDAINEQVKAFEQMKLLYDKIVKKIGNNIFSNRLENNDVVVLNPDGLLFDYNRTKIPCGFMNSVLK